ncbi:hypothetical protein Pyrfu_1896 [Pyrolobus fumarii 1A]|uniref:Glutamine amidotransferase type-2 domain-containing protein n=1 Tax=Pyrolobus fumarii (strain DSM 11204 / 1A) TaxID=694429 RepID=G0ED71_PYRF1|nr:class II glutamine amidotransferase [Pyrolobus fumarii]AEM39749.1 hypothetical protein Pyrfu_1896 [Pyrolobus fumarii 1A]
MCRMLAFWARRENSELLEPLLKAFVDACGNDEFLARVSGGEVRCHCDGWGYAAVFASDGGTQVVHEKFYAPSREEHLGSLAQATRRIISLARDSREVALVLHCRKAGRTEPVGISHAHPYREEITYYDIFFAHNGSFRKDDIALILGLPSQLYTDSALGAKLYARLLESGGEALDALRRLAFYTRTAFNTVALLVERTSGQTTITYSALTCADDPARLDYYEAYISANRDYFIYASSTVAQHPEAQVVEWSRVRGRAGRIGFYERGLHITQVVRCPPI